MIAAIIFDFDGVLADSEPLHFRVYQELLEPRGITLTIDRYRDRYLGFHDRGVFRQAANDYGLLLGDGAIEALVQDKARRFGRLVTGANVLAIASGALRREIDLMLRSAGVLESFTTIVAAGETERSKPASDP